jgi:energy-coupling factor transport system substrate-specific component
MSSVLLTFAASFYFDLIHALSNVVFLLCIARPWLRLLDRVKVKYGLMSAKP